MSVRLGIVRYCASPSARRSGRTGSRCRAARARFRMALEAERRPVGAREALQACRRTATRASSAAFGGSVAGSTAKPWFWLVISTWPVSRSFTGWLAPWWPNFILTVRAPEASARSWWPRQMPNVGMPRVDELARSRRSRSRRAPGRRGRWTGTRRRASSRAPRAPASAPAPRSPAAALGQHAQDVVLDAEVVGDDVERASPGLAGSPRPSAHVAVGPLVRRACTSRPSPGRARPSPATARACAIASSTSRRRPRAGDDAAVLRALLAQEAREPARVDVGDADDARARRGTPASVCSARQLDARARQVADHEPRREDARATRRPRR